MQNLIDDQILRSLEFRFRENLKNSYSIVAEIIENLRRMYDDSNRRFHAVNQFRDLKMRENNFIDFWSNFQKLIEKLKYFNDHFLKKFIDKLFSSYQKYLSIKCDKVIDLYELTVVVKKTTEKWKIVENIEIKTQRYQTAMNVNAVKVTDIQIDMKNAANLKIILQSNLFNRSLISFVFRVIRTSDFDPIKKKTMIEKRCFNCNEIEHIVKNCSKSKMIKMNEIVKKMKFEKNSKKK